MQVTINSERSLYVKHFEGGCTTFGFDNAYEQAELLAERLGHPHLAPRPLEYGKLSVLDKTDRLIKLAKEAGTLGTWFRKVTPHNVRVVLNGLIAKGERVRIFYGDIETGRACPSEFEVIGRIGRSMGPLKVPLLIESESDSCGCPVSDDVIVRIIRVRDGKDLYRHAGFHLPEMRIVENEHPKFAYTVLVEGQPAARFKNYGKACHWVAFMHGESLYAPE